MAAGSTLSEDTKVPVKFALTVGGAVLVALLAFSDLKGDVKALNQRADANDIRDAASSLTITSNSQQLTELRTLLKAFKEAQDEMKGDLKDVKRATVPAERVVRTGGRE